MFRYFQKALRELEESADELQAEGGLKVLHEGQGVSGQDLINHKKRDKGLRGEEKKKKKEAMEDVKTIENDHVDANEVRKKKKKKREHDLENDNKEMNSYERESSKAQSRVDDSSVVSSSKEIRENGHVDVSEVRKKKKKKKKKKHDLENDNEEMNSYERERSKAQSKVDDSSVVPSSKEIRENDHVDASEIRKKKKKKKKKKREHDLENDNEEENSYERERSKAQFDQSGVEDSSVVSSSKEIRENDHVDVSEIRKKKKKKKKKKHDLENDTDEENSYERESSKAQFDQSKVDDSSVVSSSKEIKKKRKRESQMEVLDGSVKKSKHRENKSKSHKHRDKEKSDKRHEINFSSNQRTENVQMFAESNTLEQGTSSLDDSPGSSSHSNTHHCKKSSLHVSSNGHVHVSTAKDQHQEKRTKRTGDTMTDVAADKRNLVNGNNKSEAANSRVDPTDVSNIIIDEAKLREATVISNTIHETWTLSKERVKQLAEKGIKVKKGRWSIQEVDLLKFNMAHFLEHHNMTDNSPLLFHSGMDKDERKHWKRFVKSHDFYKELGKGIHRELATIYKCALRIYDANNYVGRYTEDEIKDLKRLHGIYGSNWVTIGQMMGRSRMSVNRKNSKLPPTPTGDKEDLKGKWTDDELKRLKEAVHLVTKTTDGEPVFHGIDWQGVAKIVKTRGSEQCRKKWLSKLCWSKTDNNTERKWTKSDDIKLITRFYNSGVMEECDVDWMEVKSEYDIDYSPQWIREKWTKIKKNVPNYQRLSFEDVVEYLYRAYGSTAGDKVQPGTSNDNADNTV